MENNFITILFTNQNLIIVCDDFPAFISHQLVSTHTNINFTNLADRIEKVQERNSIALGVIRFKCV
jgi:hypothetical protein